MSPPASTAEPPVRKNGSGARKPLSLEEIANAKEGQLVDMGFDEHAIFMKRKQNQDVNQDVYCYLTKRDELLIILYVVSEKNPRSNYQRLTLRKSDSYSYYQECDAFLKRYENQEEQR
jgi:hypothetical protein